MASSTSIFEKESSGVASALPMPCTVNPANKGRSTSAPSPCGSPSPSSRTPRGLQIKHGTKWSYDETQTMRHIGKACLDFENKLGLPEHTVSWRPAVKQYFKQQHPETDHDTELVWRTVKERVMPTLDLAAKRPTPTCAMIIVYEYKQLNVPKEELPKYTNLINKAFKNKPYFKRAACTSGSLLVALLFVGLAMAAMCDIQPQVDNAMDQVMEQPAPQPQVMEVDLDSAVAQKVCEIFDLTMDDSTDEDVDEEL